MKRTKITIYNTAFKPILMRGCESWILNKKMKSIIQFIEWNTWEQGKWLFVKLKWGMTQWEKDGYRTYFGTYWETTIKVVWTVARKKNETRRKRMWLVTTRNQKECHEKYEVLRFRIVQRNVLFEGVKEKKWQKWFARHISNNIQSIRFSV